VRIYLGMRQAFSSRIGRLALLAALSWGVAAGLAQDTKAQHGEPPKSQAPPTPAQPPASKRLLGESIPDNAVERAKLLDNLYAHLATAEDERAAERTAEAILRVWRASGGDTVKVLMERAYKAVNDKQHALALKLLDSVVALAPDYAEGWSQRAHVLYLENEAERALGDLRRALALDPNHFKALDALGTILREIGQPKGALQAYEKLLEVHPYWPGAKQAVEELTREVGGQRT
jgi:tetratricopeptide (TPR) repeat protein